MQASTWLKIPRKIQEIGQNMIVWTSVNARILFTLTKRLTEKS